MPSDAPITIPGMRLPSLANSRLHWRKLATIKAAQRRIVAWSLIGHQRELSPPVVVTLTRVGPRTLDDDNLAGAFKAVRDEVARWLNVDDGDTAKVSWAYAQRKGPYAVEITIQERDDEPF